MATKIFVNLPVKDLDRSMNFFKQLGYSFNPQFTDSTAACMVISEDIFAMLLTTAKFTDFLPKGKTISDTTKSTEVMTALSCDSKDEVDRLADTAIKAGGSEARSPEDLGFMYGRSFHDLDGHIWEVFWMNPDHVVAQQ